MQTSAWAFYVAEFAIRVGDEFRQLWCRQGFSSRPSVIPFLKTRKLFVTA